VGQNALSSANEKAANYNFAREQEAIGRQDSQLQDEHSQKAFDTQLAQLKSQGAIAASASDMGLSRASIASQVNASMFGLGREASDEATNFRNSRNELTGQKVDSQLRRQNQINSQPRATTASLVLGLGKAAAAGANSYQSAKKAGAR
jgi:hypothetical protein